MSSNKNNILESAEKIKSFHDDHILMNKLRSVDMESYTLIKFIYSAIITSPKITLEINLMNLKDKFSRALEIYNTYSKSLNDMDVKYFSLHDINSIWDHKLVLSLYRKNEVDINYIKQCFFYNAGIAKIQTINVIDGNRVIIDIEGNEDIIPELDVYTGVFSESSKPSYIPKGVEYLIIGNVSKSPLEYLLEYIKNKSDIVSINQIKTEYANIPTKHNISTVISELNAKCLDISYNNKKAYEITEIPLETILRCSVKGNTSYTIGYLYFNGTLPDTIRIPKILTKYLNK